MFNTAMAWLTPFILLLVFGIPMLYDAWTDRTPRAPQMEWWRNKPELAWWAVRRTYRERRGWVDIKQAPRR